MNKRPTISKAMVLGATGSLGKPLVDALLSSGTHIVGLVRNGRLDDHERLEQRTIDLATTEAPDQLLQYLKQSDPDLIVHAAVSYGDTLTDQSLSRWETMHRINALAPMDALFRYARDRQGQNPLSVVIVNSDSMFHTTPDACAYGASKASLRVLTAGLAQSTKGTAIAVSTLTLGPLADDRKRQPLMRIARDRDLSASEVEAQYLQRSNPFLAINRLIDSDAVIRSIHYLYELGSSANGMVCRLDGGSAGSLI